MALGTPIAGHSARVYVAPNTGTIDAPVAGTYVPLGRMNTISYQQQRPIQSDGVFESSTTFDFPGVGSSTFTVSGLFAKADSGGDLVRSVLSAQTTLFVKVQPDNAVATDFSSVLARVGTTTWGAGLNGAQTFSIQFANAATPVDGGTTTIPNLLG